MRGIVRSAFVVAFFTGCLSAPAPVLSGSAGTSGGSGPGSAGDTGTGGITSGSAGATGSAGMMEGAGGDASGAAGTGGSDTGTGGTSTGSGGSGGAAGSGGSSTGGAGDAAGTAGTTGRGGTSGTGGMAGTTGRGGTTGAGGMAGAAGRGGAGGAAGTGGTTGTAGSTGTGGTTSACAPVDGLRVDDPCGSLLSGNACLHKGKTTDDGTPFSAMKAVTMGGTTGTTYQVKIHFRGVTEPTHIMSGTPGTPATFLTGGTRYPDGSQESTYQQWRLTTTNPNQHYYLNAFNSVGLAHIVELIDYDQTIPVAAGATVTLDVYDGNAHEISNTVNTPPLAPSGVPGSMSSGQFMQLNVDGCN